MLRCVWGFDHIVHLDWLSWHWTALLTFLLLLKHTKISLDRKYLHILQMVLLPTIRLLYKSPLFKKLFTSVNLAIISCSSSSFSSMLSSKQRRMQAVLPMMMIMLMMMKEATKIKINSLSSSSWVCLKFYDEYPIKVDSKWVTFLTRFSTKGVKN